MSFSEALLEAWISIRAHALRSGLAILGIAIGVGALVAVFTIGAGTQRDVMRSIESLGGSLLYVGPAEIKTPGVEKRFGVITLEDAAAIAERVPNLEAVAPVVSANGRAIWRNKNAPTNVQGTTNGFFVARRWKITHGRAFLPSEIERGAKVGIIGRSTAKSLFGPVPLGAIVGEIVRIDQMPVEIVGVLEPKGLAPQGADQDDRLVLPVKTVQLRLQAASSGDRTAVSSIYIGVKTPAAVAAAQKDIRNLLRARHRLKPGTADDFTVVDLMQVQKAAGETSRALQFWLSIVASISLVVGGINIMNVMLVSVTERTREIGIRMALGARSSDLVKQFLVEALAMSSVGGLIGIVAGIGLAFLAGKARSIPIEVNLPATLIAMLFALGVGAAFSAYPAYRAAKQDPVRALKSE